MIERQLLIRVCITITLAFGVLVCISSFPPAIAEITAHPASPKEEPFNLFSQANQIKMLLGCISVLLGANMWWIRNAFVTNEKRHNSSVKRITHIENELSSLGGEHRMSMSLNGCAADPAAIRAMIEETMKSILKSHVHTRASDKIE